MWRACVSLLVALSPAVAHAGVLAQVVDGINEASDNDGPGGSDGQPDDDDSSSSSSSPGDSGCCWSSHEGGAVGAVYLPSGPPAQVRTDVYAGMQSVEGSDGSVTLEVRSIYHDFSLGVRGTSFYERLGHDEYVHLDLWWLGGAWRIDHDERFAAWAEVGLAGLNNNDDLSMTGLSLGARLDRELDGEFALTAAARRSWFEDGVAATELLVGVHVAVVQVSYRLVDFNVGPPLHGPEVGVALTF